MKRKPKLNFRCYIKKKKQKIAHMKIGSIQTPYIIEISREDKVQISTKVWTTMFMQEMRFTTYTWANCQSKMWTTEKKNLEKLDTLLRLDST